MYIPNKKIEDAKDITDTPLVERRIESTNKYSQSLFDVPIWNGTMDSAIDWMVHCAKINKSTKVGFVNANNLNIAYKNTALKIHYRSCDRVFADGMGVNLASKIAWPKDQAIKSNINGTDLFPILCDALEREGQGIYLLGASKGVARRVAVNLNQTNPDLKVCGYHDGYLNDELTNHRLIKDINRSGASVLLVAMGTPIQETWLDENGSQLRIPVKISVGGLFDFYSNRVPRAPQWFRNLGSEWIWRLAMEPKRMWKRYLLGNPLFMLRVGKEALSKSFTRSSRILNFNISFSRFVNEMLKIVLGIIASTTGLIMLSPVLIIIAFCIVFESNGGPL